MNSSEPLITSLESIRRLKQQRYNPMRTLKPSTLTTALESFDIGYLREGAILFEAIADKDDTIKSVKPKREKEVSQLDKQVVALPGSGDAGEEHRLVLEGFWNNVRTVNAYDRNEKGGFRRLVKQMMTSVSYRYAAHHIVWQPTRDGLRATFEFVPLWLFENRTGTLRYLRDPFAQDGELLSPDEWMVTHGDGLMIACSIGYLAKRSAFNDWLIFSEKFSVPGILGRTSAKKDSPEGLVMRRAVQSFGHDWTGVIYGDDGTHEKPIDIIQATGNPSGMPMPAVVERVDRKFAALYRGADLSTMSAGSGEGSGASLQGKETKILLADDAETINETLAEVSRMVIAWHFGHGTEPLAAVRLMVPSDEDEKFYLESVKTMQEMGVRISKDATLERLGIQEADEGEDALGENPETRIQMQAISGEEIANAGKTEDFEIEDRRLEEGMDALRAALAVDLKPLGDALFSAYQSEDVAAMMAALKKISKGMPDLAGDAAALSDVLATQMVSALAGEETEDVENGDFQNHPFRGNQHRGWSREGETKSWTDQLGRLPQKNGFLSAEENQQRMMAAISRCRTLQRDVPKAAFREGLGQVDLPYGRPGNPDIDFEGGYGATHIEAKHGKSALDRVPSILAHGKIHNHEGDANKRYVALGSDLVVMGRKDARHSWVISSFHDTKKTNRLNQGR